MARPGSRFIVAGAGGHGRVVADLVRSLGHEVVGYADADARKMGRVVDAAGAAVTLTQEALVACARRLEAWPFRVDAVALGIGDNAARVALFELLEPELLPPLVHLHSWVSGFASVGAGAVVLGGVIVNNGARLGEASIANSSSIVEHDCAVGRGVHLSPGAVLCGGVQVGSGSWIGARAVVTPGVSIGSGCVVGAGGVVIRDVEDGCTVVGNPARPIPERAPARLSVATSLHPAPLASSSRIL